MVVEKLGKRDQRDEAQVFAEGPVGQVDEDGPVVLVVELFLLKDRVRFLAFFELAPFLLEGVQVQLSGRDDCRVLEGGDFFLRPEAGDVALLREVLDHEVPRVAFVLLGQQEHAVNHQHPILPSLGLIDEELVLEGQRELLLSECLRRAKHELFSGTLISTSPSAINSSAAMPM